MGVVLHGGHVHCRYAWPRARFLEGFALLSVVTLPSGPGAASLIVPRKAKPRAMWVLSAKRCMTDMDGLPPGTLPSKTQIFVGAPVVVSI